MRRAKTPSVEQLQLGSRFEGLCATLASPPYAGHLDRPLAYWALPTDRRLPLALLGRTLRDLLQTPFDQLAATPGIGQKKICSFVRLLTRAAETDPASLPAVAVSLAEHAVAVAGSEPSFSGDGFDPAGVSEVLWSQWRASVVEHGLGAETLGRLAPSLQQITRVIWNTPLGAYTECALSQIRTMKTHGEKRVRAILEVFHCVHSLLSQVRPQQHLVVRLVPHWIDRVEQWIGRALQRAGVPGEQEMRENLVHPILEQIRIDASPQIVSVAESRLGLSGPTASVRQVARTMGLTRARVYQLLNEINDVLLVRWPLGRHQMYQLRDKLLAEAAEMPHPPDLQQFTAAVELFYPDSRRGAAGPLEARPSTPEEEELLPVG